MKNFIYFSLLLALNATIPKVKAENEILNVLNTANDLTLQEVNALMPLFIEFQKQYDAIKIALNNQISQDVVSWQKAAIPETDSKENLDFLLEMLIKPNEEKSQTFKYETKLPTLQELLKESESAMHTKTFTQVQKAELEDLQEIMQETLDEAQMGIDQLVRRALKIESEMLKLNRPKIAMYIYRALSILFRYSSQLGRAAYCVYSHVPQLNESLVNLNEGVDCYVYTKKLLMTIEQEVVKTIGTIKKNVFDLAKIYKRIAAKHSVVGKIITGILSLFKIQRDVRDILAVTTKALDDLENQLPNAAVTSVNCGLDFVETLPQMLQTAVNVTTCVTFIDTDETVYEFLLPEAERDLEFGDSK